MEAPCHRGEFKLNPWRVSNRPRLPPDTASYNSLDRYPPVELEFRDEPGWATRPRPLDGQNEG